MIPTAKPDQTTLASLRLPSPIEAEPLDRTTIAVVLIGIPVGLLGLEMFGFALSGWAWATAAGVGLMAALAIPLPQAALRVLTPLLLYLALDAASLAWTPDIAQGVQVIAKYLAVALVFVVGYRAAESDDELLRKLRTWAFIILPATIIVYVRAAGDPTSTIGWIRGGNSARPMVMSIALLYLLSTIGRSRRFTIASSFFAFLLAAMSGGRMGTAVLALMILLNPATRFSWRTRALLAFLGLALFAVSLEFDAVQDRYFVGRSEGTIQDILLLEQNFNAAGRDNNWPAVYEACSKRHLWGFGAGATAMITLDATGGRTGHPHNEFLRIYCESGIVGLAVFWSFFLRVGWRGLALFRTRKNEVGATAALAVLALLFFSSTDNATIYTGIFMLPLALILGIAERAYDRRLRPVSVPGAGGW